MNWQRWIRPGLVVTVLVALVALYVRTGAIEQDLAARVTAELAADGQGWAQVSVSARDVRLEGVAPSSDSQERAVRDAARVAGVRSVADASGLLPLASPYVWTARRDGSAVVLSGSVPSDGARAQVMAAARRALPQGELRDTMTLARGAPISFGAAASFGLERLAELSQGTVTLTDATLAVSGIAGSAADYKAALAALGADAPASVNVGPVDVQPARADPFVWSATYDGSAVTVVGYVPNDIVRQTLNATLKATLPGAAIHEQVTIASGAPSGFAEAASFAIGVLKNLDQGGVTLDGLHLDITGAARSVDDYESLQAVLSGAVPDGMTVVSSAITPAPVSPYGWQGVKENGTVVLSGYVPTAAGLDELVASARIVFAGLAVDDRVRVASGEPRMDWIGAVKFAMSQLAQLDHGRVSVSDHDYTIEGVASTPESYAAIGDVNGKTLPASLTLASAAVTPPVVSPYRLSIVRKGAGVVLTGNVPDPDARAAIVAAAHDAFGNAAVVDDLAFASGAPAGFADVVATLLGVASRLAGGRVDLADKTVALDGLVYQPAAVDEIADTLSTSLPDSFTVAAADVATGQTGQPLAPDQCSGFIQTVLKTGRIQFDGNKAEISSASDGLLDRMSAAVERCSGVVVEVGAHSDSQGSASRNRDRTQARAEAIVDYLVDAGVRREDLVAVGYGESKPIASNDTAEGRAANQRIEFTVSLPKGG